MNFLEQFQNKNIFHISDSDLDGIGCRIIATYFILPICKQYTCLNTSDRSMSEFNWNNAEKNDIIIFTDITPNNIEMYNKLIKMNKIVLIFDHHETSRNQLTNNEIVKLNNYYYSTDKCASKIFFDELTKGLRVKRIVAQLVQLIDIYDLYKIEDLSWRSARALNNLLYESVNWRMANYQTDTQKYQKFIDNQLQKIYKSKEFYFTAEEKKQALHAEDKEKKNYQQAKKSLKFRTDEQGNKYGYFQCSSKVSWIASLLLREYPDVRYFICHSTFLETYKHEDNGKISLRSQKDFDVSAIAVKWGHGGHPQAAGVELPLEEFYKLRDGKIHLI